MKKLSKNSSQTVSEFFRSPVSSEEKAWGLILDFYNYILTYMDENAISKADLARKLNRSRSAISQMFNKTPNITVKKMVEVADAVGIDFTFVPKTSLQTGSSKSKVSTVKPPIDHNTYRIHPSTNEISPTLGEK